MNLMKFAVQLLLHEFFVLPIRSLEIQNRLQLNQQCLTGLISVQISIHLSK
jgi:hypothetical protein